MIDPNNPFDSTMWDPDGEHAIEDPFHGPSAVQGMLQTPAMPFGDGRYYQPGGSYAFGTNYVDSKDRPLPQVIRIVSGADAGLESHEGHEIREWLEAYHAGGDALTTLEAGRQQKRLEQTGFAYCFKPSDVCPDGKRLEDCQIGAEAFEGAEAWAADQTTRSREGTISNTLAWLGGQCAACSLSCEVAVKTIDGEAQETRVAFYRPDPGIPTIYMETARPRPLLSDEAAARLAEAFDRLEEPGNDQG